MSPTNSSTGFDLQIISVSDQRVWHRKSLRLPMPNGFTLLELILVLAMMVVLATLAGVNWKDAFRQQYLLKAADQVRAAWMQARIDAIKTGRVQVFHHTVQGNRFYWTSQASMDDPQPNPLMSDVTMGPIAFDSMDDSTAPVAQQMVVPKRLKQGIRFAGANVRLDQKSSLLLTEAPDPETLVTFQDLDDPQTFRWGMPIYFFPDGTCSSAELMLQNEHLKLIRIYLRDLTGIARVGPVETMAEAGLESPIQ